MMKLSDREAFISVDCMSTVQESDFIKIIS